MPGNQKNSADSGRAEIDVGHARMVVRHVYVESGIIFSGEIAKEHHTVKK